MSCAARVQNGSSSLCNDAAAEDRSSRTTVDRLGIGPAQHGYGLRSKKTRLSHLPAELLLLILSALPRDDLVSVRRVSRTWRDLADETLAKHARFRPWLLYPSHLNGPADDSLAAAERGFKEKPALLIYLARHDDDDDDGPFGTRYPTVDSPFKTANRKCSGWLRRIAKKLSMNAEFDRVRNSYLEDRLQFLRFLALRRLRRPSLASDNDVDHLRVTPGSRALSFKFPCRCLFVDQADPLALGGYGGAGRGTEVMERPGLGRERERREGEMLRQSQVALVGFSEPGVEFTVVGPFPFGSPLFLPRLNEAAGGGTTTAAAAQSSCSWRLDLPPLSRRPPAKFAALFGRGIYGLSELRNLRRACPPEAIVVIAVPLTCRRPSHQALVVGGERLQVELEVDGRRLRFSRTAAMRPIFTLQIVCGNASRSVRGIDPTDVYRPVVGFVAYRLYVSLSGDDEVFRELRDGLVCTFYCGGGGEKVDVPPR